MKTACVLPMLVLALAALVGGSYTPEQIRQKGFEVLEEDRLKRGHWMHALSHDDLEFMENHIGPNGLGFIGFFVGEHIYKEHKDDPDQSSRHQHKDDLFREFKRLADDQSWIERMGMGHKKWVFAWSHDRVLAEKYGCGGDNKGAIWDHMCIIVMKTSRSGETTFSHPATRLTKEAHHKMVDYLGFRHEPNHILPHLRKIIKVTVSDLDVKHEL